MVLYLNNSFELFLHHLLRQLLAEPAEELAEPEERTVESLINPPEPEKEPAVDKLSPAPTHIEAGGAGGGGADGGAEGAGESATGGSGAEGAGGSAWSLMHVSVKGD